MRDIGRRMSRLEDQVKGRGDRLTTAESERLSDAEFERAFFGGRLPRTQPHEWWLERL